MRAWSNLMTRNSDSQKAQEQVSVDIQPGAIHRVCFCKRARCAFRDFASRATPSHRPVCLYAP